MVLKICLLAFKNIYINKIYKRIKFLLFTLKQVTSVYPSQRRLYFKKEYVIFFYLFFLKSKTCFAESFSLDGPTLT